MRSSILPPTRIDLNGKWRDDHANTMEIAQSGKSVTLRTANGGIFEGTLSGDWLEVSHVLTLEETKKDLPIQIRYTRSLARRSLYKISALWAGRGSQ
jgi:hypothetical protein